MFAVRIVCAADEAVAVFAFPFDEEAAALWASFGVEQKRRVIHCEAASGEMRAAHKIVSVVVDFVKRACLAKRAVCSGVRLGFFNIHKAYRTRFGKFLEKRRRILVVRQNKCPVFRACDCDIKKAAFFGDFEMS